VRWSPDRRRIATDRILEGVRFRHDIWIPSDEEIRTNLQAAGFRLLETYGGLDCRPWEPDSERWIFRTIRG